MAGNNSILNNTAVMTGGAMGDIHYIINSLGATTSPALTPVIEPFNPP